MKIKCSGCENYTYASLYEIVYVWIQNHRRSRIGMPTLFHLCKSCWKGMGYANLRKK